jgi:hypothetical protein
MIYYNHKEKRKGAKIMKYNLWKSTLTGKIYEAPTDFIPQFGGWELVGTIIKEG